MSDPALAIQGAIVGLLRGNTDAGANVFDRVPAGSPYPRITVGNGQSVPVNEEADLGCGYDPTESFLQVDIWSVAVGKPEVKRIASQTRGLLHEAAPSLTGHVLEQPFTVSSIVYSTEQDQTTAGGLVERARMSVEARTVPAT